MGRMRNTTEDSQNRLKISDIQTKQLWGNILAKLVRCLLRCKTKCIREKYQHPHDLEIYNVAKTRVQSSRTEYKWRN